MKDSGFLRVALLHVGTWIMLVWRDREYCVSQGIYLALGAICNSQEKYFLLPSLSREGRERRGTSRCRRRIAPRLNVRKRGMCLSAEVFLKSTFESRQRNPQSWRFKPEDAVSTSLGMLCETKRQHREHEVRLTTGFSEEKRGETKSRGV